ncbi:C-GCAxxG-C-C family protein [Desulfosporosinus sp. PR]|uniref:C-GCAxxG-C-C family protein n=1 Tax=Candidatus Desulfosporosinus nitrosoreducens TaxID=3401928 RepID=UPI0027E965D2|nr:C-GCAxxG-C-C family protein [Desulfosporosinus sp. PR]MDQ7094455.1 C-GCAxxG-C-C family protein [Desulfosporosinus sp. PR]
MQFDEYINERVHSLYWNDDINCATTMIKILAEIFKADLCSQIIEAAIGMHGAGKYGAQCGLIEGALMFLGIFGRQRDLRNEEIVSMCYDLAKKFEEEFGSLNCKTLRSQGFKPDNPPHLCEELTKKAIAFTQNYLGSAIA